ncbi:putative dehydratase [[Actinomadura] parvosata subsp. kistnae]|uniref:ApeI dehydratase-like domain-containing protein n=1 Tax=[Actinomadura] parvosata subsp. kistnae TaxID=1909395 RepID=A0A1V0AC72_9ACTN|nr:hypothetical protein [Nonomuraea sp. ATCC 55076]AQZ67818.1 hypothetical protein BKM31_45835 [Nonomuraea sp. ATCC 55076]SPL93864.1 putative dehydratase [Actinomadura parvosata subsp. kistnae]
MTALTATVLLDPDEPVLAGHYPGFPVFPGVRVVELADQTVRASAADLELAEIVSARFLRPVLPGDLITVEATLRGGDCTAVVTTDRGETARLRLRYREIGKGGNP